MFLNESPPPGRASAPIGEEGVLRYKSGGHHTEGAPDWQGAMVHLRELREQFKERGTLISDDYVCLVPWPMGSVGATALLFPNFIKREQTATEAFAQMGMIQEKGGKFVALDGVVD